MRQLTLGLVALLLIGGPVAAEVVAQAEAPKVTPAPTDKAQENANPCRDEVAAALSKLRKSSWFQMTTNMITEQGPTVMEIDYVLPDKMRQKVTQTLTQTSSEVVLVGEKAWGNQGAGWQELPNDITQTLRSQMYENVVQQQTDVGNYSCKGRVTVEGREAMSYRLEGELAKDETTPRNQAFRMFYVDAVTGLPVSNALLAPGREKTPLFKATYSYPLDLKIEPPKDVKPAAAEDKK